MHRISRAPVLSATRSRDSCWITSVSYVCQFSGDVPELGGTSGPCGPAHSLGLCENLHDAPALGGGQRAGLHHQNPVADAARVLLVVHLQLPRPADHLAVEGVLDAVLHLDDHGLVHLVADHEALADLALVTRSRSVGVVAHAVVLTSSGATE